MLLLNKTKIMSTEELYHINIDNEEIRIVTDLLYFGPVINANGDSCQENRICTDVKES